MPADGAVVEVRHDDAAKERFDLGDMTANLNAAFEYVLKHQGQSFDYATRYGGWTVVTIDQDGKAHCAVCDSPHPVPGMHRTPGR